MKLPLIDREKTLLKKHKLSLRRILEYAADELEILLEISPERAKILHALAEFQSIPSIGIHFAEDLVFMGFTSFQEMKGKQGAMLIELFEQKKGYWIDPCVEDQFRLAVYYAETGDTSKNWWDFTPDRKKYRQEKGYPPNRPSIAWYETVK